jgi:hypothetical protein
MMAPTPGPSIRRVTLPAALGVALLAGGCADTSFFKREGPRKPETLERQGRAGDYRSEFERYCGSTSGGEPKQKSGTDGANRGDWRCRGGKKAKKL